MKPPITDREWLAQVSHELRTPLNAVLGFVRLLTDDPALHLTPAQRAWLGHVHEAGSHAAELVNDLLDLARIEQGGWRFDTEPIELHPLAMKVLSLLQPTAAEHTIALECMEDQPGARACADRRALQQVLLNLVTNAVKYNRVGGRVVVRLACGSIEVRDTGRGLAQAELERLFQPFNRLGAEATDIPGSGLGLVITKRLVEAMGGTIAARSTPGTGTTFAVGLRAPV